MPVLPHNTKPNKQGYAMIRSLTASIIIATCILPATANPIVTRTYCLASENVQVEMGRFRSKVSGSYLFIRKPQGRKQSKFTQPIVLIPVFIPNSQNVSRTLVNSINFKVTDSMRRPSLAVASNNEVKAIVGFLPTYKHAKAVWFCLDFPPINPKHFSFKVSYTQPNYFVRKEPTFFYVPYVPSANISYKKYKIVVTPEKGYRLLLGADSKIVPSVVKDVYHFTPIDSKPILVQLMKKDYGIPKRAD